MADECSLTLTMLRCEYRTNPLGIDALTPRLSWLLAPGLPTARGLRQTAYQILVATSLESLGQSNGDLWDSGKVGSDQSNQIEYAGQPLTSRTRCYWKVRVWDQNGIPSSWSEPAFWTMGLLKPSDWRGQWIDIDEPPQEEAWDSPLENSSWIWFPEGENAELTPPGVCYLRRTLTLPTDSAIKSAQLTMVADNEFVFYLNGEPVGMGNNRRMAFNYDATRQLRPGRNVLAIMATNSGNAPNPAGVIGVLRVEFEQSDPVVLVTDREWLAFNQEVKGWEQSELDDTNWPAVKLIGHYGMHPWGPVGKPDGTRLPARMLRREFSVGRTVKNATAYVCGLGLFELWLNGEKIGDHVLEPGLTEYRKRCYYVTSDVKKQLKPGDNAVGVILGNGRYFAPRRTIPIDTRTFGQPVLKMQIEIEYDDGSVERIVSDEQWRVTTGGPIRANNEYDGEEYDARQEIKGWAEPKFDDSKWKPVHRAKGPEGALVAQMIEPIRIIETIKPVAVKQPQPGKYIFDLGQNMVGWCRLTVSGPRGTQVTMRHAETLQSDGTLYVDNLRSALATDTYILKGGGMEVFEPRFVYHGFRYVEVTGFPEEPSLSTLDGRVVHDAVMLTGTFSCSNPLLNHIHSSIRWGFTGNYRSIPTDCPQRDERQGWLGDRSAESRGETYLHDLAGFYNKWLTDIEDAQKDDGTVADVAPPYWTICSDSVTWPSTFVILPGVLYEQYADRHTLQEHYPAMKKWIDHMCGYLKDDLIPRDTYGDWCVPPESREIIFTKDPKRKTAGELLATAYFYYDLRLMASYATTLNHQKDAERFETLAAKLKTAFNEKYFDPKTNLYGNGTQTSCVLPLAFGLVPEDQRAAVFQNQVDKITQESQGHIGTGLIGGQWLMRVLCDNGRIDLAYAMASQKTYPSWGYMIENGATTIWELWNGNTAEPSMNSGNHVMLVGDLLAWMYEYLGGIRPDPAQPGFKHILLHPRPVGDLTELEATHLSPYGKIESAWRIENGEFRLNVSVPPNTTATVFIPAKDAAHVREGGKPATEADGVKFLRLRDQNACYRIESGNYSFVAPWPSQSRENP
jgi:alpha-L-rhamnosidase